MDGLSHRVPSSISISSLPANAGDRTVTRPILPFLILFLSFHFLIHNPVSEPYDRLDRTLLLTRPHHLQMLQYRQITVHEPIHTVTHAAALFTCQATR